MMWTILYIIVASLPLPFVPKGAKISESQALDVRNRIVSIFQSLVLITFAAPEFYFFPGSCGDLNTTYEKRLIYVSIGYFIYDFIAMAYYGLLDIPMAIHHWLCLVGMSLPLTYGMSANYVVQGMFAAECSDPLMNIRKILGHYGLQYTRAYETSEILFMIIYIFGRVMLGM